MEPALIDIAAFEELATGGVPYVGRLGIKVERLERGFALVRLPYRDELLRPGGTICGPAIMALADITVYGVVLSMIGRVELAVTTDLNVHFLRRPKPGDLLARGEILKLGRVLAVGQVHVETEAGERVAHATSTYSIPPLKPES